MYIDTHCHVYSEFYSNIDEVVDGFLNNNVKKIVNCADTIENCKEVLLLSNKYPGIVYPVLGIHPNNVTDNIDAVVFELESLVKSNEVSAIGEIGLDYYWTKERKDDQINLFKKQLDLASKYNLPVVVHSREATEDVMNILKTYNLRGVIHCFSGSVETAREYIRMGYYLGVNGVITFKNNKKTKEVIEEVGLGRVIIETDSPFLTPEPFRKYRNEPKYVVEVSKFLARLLDMPENEVMNITTNNAIELFSIAE